MKKGLILFIYTAISLTQVKNIAMQKSIPTVKDYMDSNLKDSNLKLINAEKKYQGASRAIKPKPQHPSEINLNEMPVVFNSPGEKAEIVDLLNKQYKSDMQDREASIQAFYDAKKKFEEVKSNYAKAFHANEDFKNMIQDKKLKNVAEVGAKNIAKSGMLPRK